MARRCEATGKGVQVGHKVSHSNIKTKTRKFPNLQPKRFWSANLKRFVSMRVCTSTIRTIDKLGFDAFLRRTGLKV